MGLLSQQQPMQQPMGGAPMGGGLLGGMGGMQQQGMPQQAQPQGEMQMPPEMMQVVEQIKMMEPDQKNEAAQQIILKIQQMPKSDQEKQRAMSQFISAIGG